MTIMMKTMNILMNSFLLWPVQVVQLINQQITCIDIPYGMFRSYITYVYCLMTSYLIFKLQYNTSPNYMLFIEEISFIWCETQGSLAHCLFSF